MKKERDARNYARSFYLGNSILTGIVVIIAIITFIVLSIASTKLRERLHEKSDVQEFEKKVVFERSLVFTDKKFSVLI